MKGWYWKPYKSWQKFDLIMGFQWKIWHKKDLTAEEEKEEEEGVGRGRKKKKRRKTFICHRYITAQ